MRTTILISLFLTISNYTFATCYPIGDETYRPSLNDNSKILGLNSRVKYAQALLNATKNWSLGIPRLSPSERTWLKREIDAGGVRRRRAYMSKEYSINRLTPILDKNIKILNILANNRAKNTKAEIYLWSWLAMNILDQNFISSTVTLSTKYNILSPMLFGVTPEIWRQVNEDQFIYHLCSGHSQDILYYIVMPYLRNEE